MDWFDQDDNLFSGNDRDSFSNDNTLEIENLFFKKQNSLSLVDYEVKLQDFVLNKYEGEKDSKFLLNEIEKIGTNYSNTLNIASEQNKCDKIFSINKDKKKMEKKLQKTTKSKIISKEELARHPFLNSNYNPSGLYGYSSGLSANQDTLIGTTSPNSKKDSVNQSSNSNCNNYYPTTASIEEHSENVSNCRKTTTEKNELTDDDEEVDEDNYEENSQNSLKSNYSNKSHKNYHEKIMNLDKFEFDSLINNNPLLSNLNNFTNNTNVNVMNTFKNNYSTSFNTNIQCNGSSTCPYFIPLQNLSFSERMKIKKEKAKMLLEKKTKRENSEQNFVTNTNYNENLNISKYFNCENLTNSFYNGVSPDSSHLVHNNYQNTYSSSNYLKVNDENNLSENKSRRGYTKKEKKMLRNRISAQRSRDRKKKEMDDLKIVSQNLLNETCLLKRELESRDREIRDWKDKFSQLCKDCQDKVIATKKHPGHCYNNLNTSSTDIIYFENLNNQRNLSIVDSSNRRFTNSLKYSLMAGFLVVICLLGTLSYNNISNKNNKDSLQGRILSTEETEINHPKKYTEDKVTANDLKASTGVIVYNPEINYNRDNNPFSIVKDLNKFMKKKINNSSDLDKNTYNDKSLSSFLGKKRREFFMKMQKREKKHESEIQNGFLQAKSIIEETEDMCANVDGVAWSIQEELALQDEDNRSGIILKENNNYQNYNGVVPIKEARYTYEKSVLRDNIQSMYCKDFLTTAEENAQIFNKLFDKLNDNTHNDKKKEGLHSENEKNDDCLYLHIIVPTIDNLNVNTADMSDIHITRSGNDSDSINVSNQNTDYFSDNHSNSEAHLNKKVFYEVGCKIFEINKIYK